MSIDVTEGGRRPSSCCTEGPKKHILFTHGPEGGRGKRIGMGKYGVREERSFFQNS